MWLGQDFRLCILVEEPPRFFCSLILLLLWKMWTATGTLEKYS